MSETSRQRKERLAKAAGDPGDLQEKAEEPVEEAKPKAKIKVKTKSKVK